MSIQVKNKWLMPVVAIGLLLVLIAMMAGLFSDKVSPDNTVAQVSFTGKTQVVTVQAVEHTEYVPATVIAKQNTVISSRILAPIKTFAVRAGQVVEQGDLLIELEDGQLKAQVAQAKARLDAVNSQLAQAQLQLNRAITLREQGLTAINDLDVAKTNFAELQASRNSAAEQLEQAQVGLSYSQIRAPIAGKVVDRMAEPGDTVSPGQVLLSIYNPQSLQIEAAVREQKAVSLKLGQSLAVEVASLNIKGQARVAEIVPVADSSARSFLVKLEFANDVRLMPGMYARVSLPSSSETLVVINPQLITQFGQLNMVKVLNNNQVERRFIRTGIVLGENKVVVLSGLNAGELLVLEE